MINSLTTEVDSRNFENPAIQTFYSRLQAIALDEKNPEPVEDLIAPDEESIKLFFIKTNNMNIHSSMKFIIFKNFVSLLRHIKNLWWYDKNLQRII